jgi:hypothetical protein
MKKLCSVALTLLIVMAVASMGLAAPVTGSLRLDLVITPDCNTLTFLGPSVSDCTKVSGTLVKAEADLDLTLMISGLDITSSSTFTFKGIETEILRIVATIGALTARTTLVFAPSLTELEIVRSTTSLSARYCVAFHNGGDITPPFSDCPTADSTLFYMIENFGVYHPIVQNLGLAYLFDSVGALDGALYFVKKVAEINISIAGMTLGLRAIFANLGDAQTPNFVTGLVINLEGQTVSGVLVKAETWFGARQGMECFAECKPAQRVYGGIVVTDFGVQEEKLFIRNLTIAGVSHSIRAEFQFFTQAGDAGPGLTYLEWGQRFRIQPLNIAINNLIRFDGTLLPQFTQLQAMFKAGDVSVTAIFYIYQALTQTWEAQLAEFISVFDPPGVTVTSDLVLCTESLFSGACTSGVLEHDLYLGVVAGNFTFDVKLIFFSFFSSFQEVWFDATYLFSPAVQLANSYVISTDALVAFSISVLWKF